MKLFDLSRHALFLAFLLTHTGAVTAQMPDPATVSSWKCDFPAMVSTEWSNSEPVSSFTDQDDSSFHIDNVDLEVNSARMIGNVGSSDLVALAGFGAVHFLEQAPSGNVIVTSIFANVDGVFPAVHSRHVAVVPGTTPVVSQAHGACVPWQ